MHCKLESSNVHTHTHTYKLWFALNKTFFVEKHSNKQTNKKITVKKEEKLNNFSVLSDSSTKNTTLKWHKINLASEKQKQKKFKIRLKWKTEERKNKNLIHLYNVYFHRRKTIEMSPKYD